MRFIEPMTCKGLPDNLIIRPGDYVVEEKFDGHRLVLGVADGRVRAWSRDGLNRVLPEHITFAASRLPNGVYDGELLVPGKRSYGVTAIKNVNELFLTVFDVMELLGKETMTDSYRFRRAYLTEIFGHPTFQALPYGMGLAVATPVDSVDAIKRECEKIWKRDGEGLIVKRVEGLYHAGKRTKEFMKLKALRSAALTIVGYIPALMGPYAKVLLEDADGNRVPVKTRNTKERERLAARPDFFIGKKLLIEFQERTPDGSYRHPRWDRLEDE